MGVQTIGASGAATDPVKLVSGELALDIFGTFVGTVTIQRAVGTIAKGSLQASDWFDDSTYTEVTSMTGIEGYQHWYRATFKAGEYTSGTASILIAQAP
jgi:hypothetical protein